MEEGGGAPMRTRETRREKKAPTLQESLPLSLPLSLSLSLSPSLSLPPPSLSLLLHSPGRVPPPPSYTRTLRSSAVVLLHPSNPPFFKLSDLCTPPSLFRAPSFSIASQKSGGKMKLHEGGGGINNTDGWLDNRVRHAWALRQSGGCPHNFHKAEKREKTRVWDEGGNQPQEADIARKYTHANTQRTRLA